MDPRHRRDLNALEVTEIVLRFPMPVTRGLVMNKPAGGMSHAGRLFQARMWREYAMDWDLPDWNIRRGWVEKVLRHSRMDCLRRARINLYLAARIRRGFN